VLIHGFSGTRLIWEPVLEALERSYDVLAVNLAGHVGGHVVVRGSRARTGCRRQLASDAFSVTTRASARGILGD
jgi:pimeloyl-ACP methyl ester carboxylesterase